MSESFKLSLMRLQTPFKHSEELGSNKGLAQYPASPTLILAMHYIPDETKFRYLEKRKNMLKYKLDNTINDERLRPYQNQDVNFLKHLEHKAIFNEQRTGKTPTTLVTLRQLNENNNLIIVPGVTLYKWKREYSEWHKGPVKIVTGTKEQRKKIYKDFNGTLIMTYGIIKNDFNDIINIRKSLDAMIVDEAHRLRNFYGIRSKRSTAQSKAIIKVSKIAKARYALTGTPAPNYAWDIFGILHYLYPDLFSSYWNFINYYFKVEEQIINASHDTVKKVIEFKSPQKEKELREFLEVISIQRKRKEVMDWIPPFDMEEVLLQPTKQILKMSNQLKKYFEYGDIVCKNALDLMIKLRRLSCSPKLLGVDELGPKLEYILQYIDDYPDKPIIITSMFTSLLEILANELVTKKIKCGMLIGLTSVQNRDELVKMFQNGKYNILLGNLDVIKEGVTLDRAETLIMIDQSLVYTDNLQVMDRPIPTNKEIALSKNEQKIIILMIEDSIDTYINGMLQLKKSSSEIINNYLQEVSDVITDDH